MGYSFARIVKSQEDASHVSLVPTALSPLILKGDFFRAMSFSEKQDLVYEQTYFSSSKTRKKYYEAQRQ